MHGCKKMRYASRGRLDSLLTKDIHLYQLSSEVFAMSENGLTWMLSPSACENLLLLSNLIYHKDSYLN